ncbi:MAG TPA: MlaD family protein [Chiayiivirga sp.]|nr:MlaD family protein [Chiayiivirga sp.]
METRANHLLIGGFAIAVVLVTLASLLWVGKFDSDRNVALYDIVFAESVIGLSKGSVVSYNGVPVGDVAALAVDPKDLGRVVVRVRIGDPSLMRRDTQATLGFAAVTGVADIRLSGGSLDSPKLASDKGVPVIMATLSPLAKFTASGEDIMVNINEVVTRISELLSTENRAHVSAVLDNLDALATTLGSERQALGEAIRQLSAASGQLQSTLASIEGAARSAQSLMSGQGGPLVAELRQTVEKLDALAASLDGLVKDNRSAVNSFSQQGLRQVGPALDELRATLTSLRALSEQISRSDSPLLGNPQPREFKP